MGKHLTVMAIAAAKNSVINAVEGWCDIWFSKEGSKMRYFVLTLNGTSIIEKYEVVTKHFERPNGIEHISH